MLEKIFIKEYFRNPFFWWSAFILVLITFHTNIFANLILQSIILYALHVPVLFVCLTIAFFLALYPIRKSLKKLSLKNETKNWMLLHYTLIVLMLIVHVTYFLSDPPVIFAVLQPQVVTNEIIFEDAIDLKMLFEYIAIPLLYAFVMTLVQNKLMKENLEIHDKFRNNLKFGACMIGVGTATYLLYVFITYLQ